MKKSLVFLIVLCLTLNPITTSALSKSEVVYGKLDDNGNIKNIYVNEHLVNNDKLDVIEDYSELKDILNINGNEKYKISNNKVTWDALGNDIFYQGKYESNLPIEVSITYKFNDEVMEIKNMIGKSGHVEIIINYVNKDKHNVKINGKNEKLYTPFVVTYATTLDAKNNSNISISNGKIISNGINNILVGMAIPGLYESLDVSELKDMDTIRVEYDTVSFELESSYSVISPKIIDSNDLEIFDKLDDLYSKSNSLQKNMNLIDENAVKLKSGSNELKSKLKTSIDDLSNNKGNALSNEELEKISNKTIDTINSMFTDDYKQNIMNNSWSSVEEVLKQNDSESVNKISENISDAFIQYLKDINEYDDYVLCEIAKSNNEDIASIESCIKIAQDITLPYVKKALESSNLKTAEYVKQNVGKKVSDAVSVSVAQSVASSVASSVSKSVANEVGNGVMSVSLETLSKSLNSLYSGVEKIDDGVSQLSEGITKFNNDGIKELTKLVNNDVKATSVRVKELVKLGENYKTIAGTNMESETKFILVTDAKKVNNEKVNKTETEEKVSFWQRIKNLFK